jgi:hypothetical protein
MRLRIYDIRPSFLFIFSFLRIYFTAAEGGVDTWAWTREGSKRRSHCLFAFVCPVKAWYIGVFFILVSMFGSNFVLFI